MPASKRGGLSPRLAGAQRNTARLGVGKHIAHCHLEKKVTSTANGSKTSALSVVTRREGTVDTPFGHNVDSSSCRRVE
jgi:hypothetical protein